MAMTKKEQAAFEDLQRQLALAKALRWPDYRPQEIDTEAVARTLGFGQVRRAWSFNTYGRRVYEGCFSSVHHSREQTDKTTTQGLGGPWYGSRLEALQALRIAMTEEFARHLAEIDQQIAQAESEIRMDGSVVDRRSGLPRGE